jgi:hypothetical protein
VAMPSQNKEQYLKGKIERTALLEKTQNTVTNSYVKER